MRNIGLIGLICLVSLIPSCGYTNKSLIAPGANSIFVETFKNGIDITKEPSSRQKYNVYKPFLETDVTNAVIDRFLYDGNLKVTDKETADLLLQGEVVNYLRQPLRYSDSKEIEEYRINIMVNFTLKDARTGKVLLQAKDLTADASYFVTGKSQKTEDSAIDVLVEDLARRLVNRIVHAEWR
jgi:outer membrane lipopolysaccharide assembly protein LptE/RlpB